MVFLPARSDCDTFLILQLMKTNIVVAALCQYWADDFSNVHRNIRVLKPSSTAKYPDSLRAVLLQQSSPTVPAYVSMLAMIPRQFRGNKSEALCVHDALMIFACFLINEEIYGKKYATAFLYTTSNKEK